MRKEYIKPILIVRTLEDEVLSWTEGSVELDDNEGGIVIPPWFFGV